VSDTDVIELAQRVLALEKNGEAILREQENARTAMGRSQSFALDAKMASERTHAGVTHLIQLHEEGREDAQLKHAEHKEEIVRIRNEHKEDITRVWDDIGRIWGEARLSRTFRDRMYAMVAVVGALAMAIGWIIPDVIHWTAKKLGG